MPIFKRKSETVKAPPETVSCDCCRVLLLKSDAVVKVERTTRNDARHYYGGWIVATPPRTIYFLSSHTPKWDIRVVDWISNPVKYLKIVPEKEVEVKP